MDSAGPPENPSDEPSPPVRNEFSTGADVGAVYQAGRDIVIAPRPRPEPLKQTPLPYRLFQDREDVLERIAELIPERDEAERIVVVEGAPCVGKREVVRKFAAMYRERFTGGDLYIDCTEFGAEVGRAGTADVEAMLMAVLSGLGVAPAHAPRGRTALRICYQTKVNQRPGPVLMVIEKATEPAQVDVLRPHAPGSLVLVTTGPGADLSQLDLYDAAFEPLGRLDERHSAELFHRAAGRAAERLTSASAELIRLCDGIPLALLVLAKRVARLHTMTDSELAAQLTDDRKLLAALVMGGQQVVSAALTTAYRGLPDRVRLAYRRLGLFPGVDFGPDVAAIVLSADRATAADLLETLADASLLQRRPVARYAFGNNLIRLHARQLAEDDGADGEPAERREALLERILEHYVLRAAFADRAKRANRFRIADHAELLAGHDDPFAGQNAAEQGRAWLDAERANLVGLVQAAYDAGFFRLAVLLADALTAYFPDRRDLTAWIATSTLGARAAAELGDARAEARLRSMMSRPLTDRGDLDQARAELDRAQRLAAGLPGELVLRASVREFAGRFLDHVGEHGDALAAYEQSGDLNAQAGERRGFALARTFAADTLRTMGEYERARESYDSALELFVELADARMAARTRIGLGVTLARLGDPAAAVDMLNEAVQELRGTHYEAQARTRLADIAKDAGDAAAERRHLLRALEIYREVGHPGADEIAARLADK